MSIDLEDLRRKATDAAEIAPEIGVGWVWPSCVGPMAVFYNSIDPATILALLDEVKQARAKALEEAIYAVEDQRLDDVSCEEDSCYENALDHSVVAIRSLIDKEPS